MGFWVCAQLQPQRERLALHCLQTVNKFEVYSPRVPVTVVNKRRKDPCCSISRSSLDTALCRLSVRRQRF